MVIQLFGRCVEQIWITLWIALAIELLGVAVLAVLAIIINMIRKRARRGPATPTREIRITRKSKLERKLKNLTC